MVNDRGSIKWTTMMLPEHAEILRELWYEDKKVCKPQLDTQQIELLENELIFAFHKNLPVVLTIYRNHLLERIEGNITKLDGQNKYIHLKLDTNENTRVPFHLLADLTIKK